APGVVDIDQLPGRVIHIRALEQRAVVVATAQQMATAVGPILITPNTNSSFPAMTKTPWPLSNCHTAHQLQLTPHPIQLS
ncbi:hypothetical protein, partial [Pseudomonas aegrilactucae]